MCLKKCREQNYSPDPGVRAAEKNRKYVSAVKKEQNRKQGNIQSMQRGTKLLSNLLHCCEGT